MKYELNTNLVQFFTGTYESIWEITEYNEEGTEEVEVEYTMQDLMDGIVTAYSGMKDYIKSELNIDFIKSLHFTGKHNSPREYNFSTDTLDFTVDVIKSKLDKTIESLKNDNKFKEFLHDNYSSRDGFWSFTPDTWQGIKDAIKNDNESTQALGAIITYLTSTDTLRSIEEMVYDDWQGNGYGGTDYKVVTE